MSEIEKLYENAGVEPHKYCYNCFDNNGKIIKDSKDCPSRKSCCNSCDTPEYNFTAEKQIELIKLLQRKNGYKFSFSSTNDNSEYLFFAHKDNTPVYDLIVAGNKCYEEALAGFINNLWQDLTDVEKEQIKEILRWM